MAASEPIIDKGIFQHLYANKEAIDRDMGAPLFWMELPGKKTTRIKTEKRIELADRNQWQVAFEFLKEEAEKIQRIFPKYVKELEQQQIKSG